MAAETTQRGRGRENGSPLFFCFLVFFLASVRFEIQGQDKVIGITIEEGKWADLYAGITGNRAYRNLLPIF